MKKLIQILSAVTALSMVLSLSACKKSESKNTPSTVTPINTSSSEKPDALDNTEAATVSTATPTVINENKEARVLEATPSYDGFNNYPIYTPESVTIEPGLNYEDYLLSEKPGNAPKTLYGYMDFSKYCEDLGIDPSTIRATGTSGIVIGNTDNNALQIKDGCDILIYRNGTIVCYYDGGRSNEFAKDGLSLYVYDNEEGRYEHGASMHYCDNTMGALELSIRAYLTGDPDPFD